MEGRINPSPVLNAPPAKESDPFFARRLLFCRYGLAGETHFKKESFRCILTLLAPVATLLPTEPSPSPNVRFRPATFPRELRSVLGCPQRSFRASDGSIQGALRLGCCRRSRSFCWAASSARPGCVTRCSVRPILEVPRYPPFPCSPFDGLSNDRYRLRPSQRSQHLEWPLCAKTGPSLNVAFDPQTNKRTRTRPDAF